MTDQIQCIDCDAVINDACGPLKFYGAIGPLCDCCYAITVKFRGEENE